MEVIQTTRKRGEKKGQFVKSEWRLSSARLSWGDTRRLFTVRNDLFSLSASSHPEAGPGPMRDAKFHAAFPPGNSIFLHSRHLISSGYWISTFQPGRATPAQTNLQSGETLAWKDAQTSAADKGQRETGTEIAIIKVAFIPN